MGSVLPALVNPRSLRQVVRWPTRSLRQRVNDYTSSRSCSSPRWKGSGWMNACDFSIGNVETQYFASLRYLFGTRFFHDPKIKPATMRLTMMFPPTIHDRP